MRKPVLARDLMRGPVRQLTTWTRARDAAAFLQRHGISGAPVVDEHGRWVGVFTQNDLGRYVQGRTERTLEAREALPDQFGETPIRELMTVGLYTLFPEATLEEVIHAMTSFRVHRVFVIQETGHQLLGVITTMDVLRWFEQENHKGSKARKETQRH